MRVAIIGAGPAGAHLAYLLSKDGAEVLLFDEREAWEKPCGGGVTSKALREFEFLNCADAPKQMVSSLRLISAREREITVTPRDDFAIYSRKELSRMMRIRAVERGAQLYCARVGKTNCSKGKWRIETSKGDFSADFLVGADGASSMIRRRMGVRFGPQDFAYGLGWNVKTSQTWSQVEVKYLDEFSGYLWLFPRTDHISYGIADSCRLSGCDAGENEGEVVGFHCHERSKCGGRDQNIIKQFNRAGLFLRSHDPGSRCDDLGSPEGLECLRGMGADR
jgi:flavin-dependent dehydrogenase